MTQPVLIIGAGGHAKVVLDVLLAGGFEVAGLLDPAPEKQGRRILGVPVLGGDERLADFPPAAVVLALGLGSVGAAGPRRDIFAAYRQRGYRFATAIHPAAQIGREVTVGEGSVVMAGVVVQPGSRIGANVILNTRAGIDHDCTIGDHAHISPGATLCGAVSIGAGSHIGAGATVIQGVNIGADCLVAAGAVVVGDIPDRSRVAGVPARPRQAITPP